MSPYAHYRPWMVTEGNHEMEYIPLLAPSFRSYNTRWDMPYAESGSTSNLYYSFDVASAHVFMLGSYTDFGVGSEQYNWLLADLKKVDRSVTPWLVVVLHAPWYNSNSAHQGDGDQMMEVMEPILYQAKVDILFAGHVHAYERTVRKATSLCIQIEIWTQQVFDYVLFLTRHFPCHNLHFLSCRSSFL
jgi:hypothetical protein